MELQEQDGTDWCGDVVELHEQGRFWWDLGPAALLPGLQMVAGGVSGVLPGADGERRDTNGCGWEPNRVDKMSTVFWSFFEFF